MCCHYTRNANNYCSAETEGLEPPSSTWATTCFRGRLLIQPDGFHFFPCSLFRTQNSTPGVGIEPTASWFRARRYYQQQLSRKTSVDGYATPFYSGRRNRTSISWFKAKQPPFSRSPNLFTVLFLRLSEFPSENSVQGQTVKVNSMVFTQVLRGS